VLLHGFLSRASAENFSEEVTEKIPRISKKHRKIAKKGLPTPMLPFPLLGEVEILRQPYLKFHIFTGIMMLIVLFSVFFLPILVFFLLPSLRKGLG